ncbi:hypothetical protein IRJ41_002649 [Triplophysa rosa]|uniref:Uncharacterized protein n=1 Tax=Triplophysa rosa TaxID=992332 RepID=A0A9W7TE58_TRIRA|nr:hypothetical protein IRJ41_002649 [Triplophysa rosa]
MDGGFIESLLRVASHNVLACQALEDSQNSHNHTAGVSLSLSPGMAWKTKQLISEQKVEQ